MLHGMTERTASQRGRWARQKGKRGERDLVKLFRKIWPKAKRGWQTRSGRDDPDVVVPYLWIESKFGIKPNPRAALEQAVADSDGTGKLPVAVIRDNGKKAFVVMQLGDFYQMLVEMFGEKDGDTEDQREDEGG